MAHDVFISYASEDKPEADGLCATLESRGVRCWIAPRDALAGIPYPEQLIEAIESSRVFVLVYSGSSNASPQVMREVERAVHHGIPIIPMRLEDVPLSKNMEYFISAPHWLDALSPPLQQHFDHVAESVALLLKRRAGEPHAPSPSPDAGAREPLPSPSRGRRERRAVPKPRLALLAGGLALLVALFFAGRALFSRGRTDPQLKGVWTLSFRNAGTDWTLAWDIAGDRYRVHTTTADGGTFRAASGRWHTVSRSGQSASGTYVIGAGTITMQGGPFGNVTWKRDIGGPSDPRFPMAGRWTTTLPIGGLTWTFVSDYDAAGSYTITGVTDDEGTLETHDGRFKTVSTKTGATAEGAYAITGTGQLSTTGPQGAALWTRTGG